MTTTTQAPPTEAIACPDWCVKHTLGGDDDRTVIHESAVSYFGDETGPFEGVSVMVEADPGDTGEGGLWPPRVNVFNANHAELRPADARRLAAHLLKLADTAERPIPDSPQERAAAIVRHAVSASWGSWPGLSEATGIPMDRLADGLWGRSTFTAEELAAIAGHIGPLIGARQRKRLSRRARAEADEAAAWVEANH